ncbi:unnamed protein product [Miscanthus lutarioriparius]|uniref:Uncharacterized protein n=1 Tax=Miscanthus lutarioriparius TaxID=422564 RepID=A0A811MIT4_9POAL|nr:unnamed protein product [Miscanthus lutarioriparius]
MEKEHSNMNRLERHRDDTKQYLDSHLSPKERWVRSPSYVRNYDQRRDNNWNSRWVPGSKDSENWRERSTDSDRKDDAPCEEVFSHSTGHGKEKDGSNHEKVNERDSNISRSWNSSYFASRGAGGGTSDHLSPDPQKLSASFGHSSYGQESDSPNSTSSHRRFTSVTSRVNSRSSHPFHLGVLSDRPGGPSRNSVRYSRIKLFEIYRTTYVRNFVMPIDDIDNDEISSLWQEDPMDPLALIAPNAEEVVILKGIEKGDITDSLAKACKDGSDDKSNPDVVALEQMKLSGREDQTGSSEDFSGEMTIGIRGILGAAHLSEHLKSEKPPPKESESIGGGIHGPCAEFGHQRNVLDQGTKVGEMVGVGENVNPENLSLYYKDPKGCTQVRVSSAPCDSPFLLLGDVMPHLQAKVRVPPGFSNTKTRSMTEALHLGSAYLGTSDCVSINKNGCVTEAENHFLESPVSSKTQNPRAETNVVTGGMNECCRNTFGNHFVSGDEKVNRINHLEVQKGLKSQAPAANSGLSLWSNNVDSGNLQAGMCGIDLAQQDQPTLACLNSQITQPEKFLSEISHDPRLLNNNQQQYLPSELHLQPLMPGVPQPQYSLLNNTLQLRQQEQQQLQQQQQHISQALPHDCSMQQLYDPSHGRRHTSLSSSDHMKLCLQRTQEILELAQKLPGHGMHDLQLHNHANVKLRDTGIIGLSESWAPVLALPLPHEVMGHAACKECSASLTQGSAVVDAPSRKESIVDLPSKKTLSSGSNEYSKVTVFEAKGFPQSCQGLAKSESVVSHISNEVHEMEISSTHPHSWKPTPGEELVKSNDKDAVIINSADDTSFPPLAPSVTQSDAHLLDGADFIEFKGTRKIRNRGEKSKGSAVKNPAPLANAIPGPATDAALVRESCSLRNIQMEEEQESGNLQQLVPASSHAKRPMDQHSHGNNSSWQGSESPPLRGNELLKMTSHVSSHSTPNSEEDLFWESCEHAKKDNPGLQSPPSRARASMVNTRSAALDIQKKGKKGKKLSSSALGFNVQSTRIMMGEIVHADE